MHPCHAFKKNIIPVNYETGKKALEFNTQKREAINRALFLRGTAHRPRLYVKGCCGSTVDCVRCYAKVVALVEIAEPLAPFFEVDQAQPLL